MTQTSPRIVFVGVHREALAPLRWLIASGERVLGLVTLTPEAMAGVSGAVDLAAPAEQAGIPVLRVRNVNEPASVEWIRSLAPDLLLVVGWTQLLKRPLLVIPKVACLGFHASLLPRYRGRAPINWALIHGERETGNTMIVLEPEADAGDIVAQRRIPILDEDDCGTLYDKVGGTEVDMLAEVLPLVRAGRLPRTPQDPALATVMPKRRPEDGGIDWTLPARRVHDWVRALTHPYPGAFTWSGGRKLWIWKTRLLDGAAGAAPGTVGTDAEGWPVVGCGQGAVRILSLQLDGEPEHSGRDRAADLVRAGVVSREPAGARS